MRVVIAGGGTGGHLFPGIAVADALCQRYQADVRFMGSEHGIERKILPQNGYAVDLLPVRGIRGKRLPEIFRALSDLIRSIGQARRLVAAFAPDLAVGVGGYAAFPAILAARTLGVPIILLEQNAALGLTNRLLYRFALRVCVSFAATAKELGDVAILTGNPVRFSTPKSTRSRALGEPLHVLIFGGSAGARRLNEVLPQAIAPLADTVEVRHQSGGGDLDAVRARYRDGGVRATVSPFIEDMGAAYEWADLVICRSGASSIAELTVLGKPSILVPYPFATGDHQTANAHPLVAAGAAWLIADKDLDPIDLMRRLEAFTLAPEILTAAGQAALQLGQPEALEAVVAICMAATRERV